MAPIVGGQNLSAAWEAYVPSDPVDNIFLRHWLLEQLRSNGSFEKQNGVVIRANLEYALNPNVKFISELETVTVFRPDTFDNAEFPWKFIAGDVPMTDFERGITEGGAAKYNFEAAKLDNLKKTMEERTNTSLFSDGTGTSGKEFGGLQLLVANNPTVGSPGLINRSVYAFFRNQQIAGTKTTNPFDNLMVSVVNNYNSCSNGIGEENPTFAVTTQAIFEGYMSLLTPIQRLNREGPGDKGISGFKGQNIMLMDIPVGYDPVCPAGNWYTLNNRNLKFIYMQWLKGEPAVRPSDGFWDVFKVMTMGNLITDNPRRLGVVTAIN
jgi:hypothetical protein